MKKHLNFFLTLIILFAFIEITISQIPPCGDSYGTNSDETNIITQMRYGTITDAISAIDLAKNTRGTALGCPEVSVNYTTPNFTEPTLNEIENVWNNAHAPTISSYNVDCPRIGRYENNAALGAYYAMQAGYYNDTSKLAEIADMMYDQQYAEWNIASPDNRNKGVYGYIHVPDTNPCYPGGVVGTSVTSLCTALPNYCVNYTNGQFSGESFAISGQDDANNWYDGGLAYDHGWVGVQMIESSIMQNDPILKQKYRNSVELAGSYAISEHCVKNHNYSAKLTWLLAELYAWTGESNYKDALNYKLNKNLIPGILLDTNSDGFVDGTSPNIAFNTLTSSAQLPGRMWDGHNSISWYHAMNTWALTEAYVAFRDQGDVLRANEIKPYMISMLDNLSNEIINEGVITPNALGIRDITYAILTGLWKVSQYESEVHSNWEQAAWALWNSGYFNNYNTHSVCVGLYLVVKNSTPFIPLKLREPFVLDTEHLNFDQISVNIYPNPTNEFTIVTLDESVSNRIEIYNFQGVLIQEKIIYNKTYHTMNLETLRNGLYFIRVTNSFGQNTIKLVIE
jgi:hypothetical protein